jgi:hypothetical protein
MSVQILTKDGVINTISGHVAKQYHRQQVLNEVSQNKKIKINKKNTKK